MSIIYYLENKEKIKEISNKFIKIKNNLNEKSFKSEKKMPLYLFLTTTISAITSFNIYTNMNTLSETTKAPTGIDAISSELMAAAAPFYALSSFFIPFIILRLVLRFIRNNELKNKKEKVFNFCYKEIFTMYGEDKYEKLKETINNEFSKEEFEFIEKTIKENNVLLERDMISFDKIKLTIKNESSKILYEHELEILKLINNIPSSKDEDIKGLTRLLTDKVHTYMNENKQNKIDKIETSKINKDVIIKNI